MNQNHCINCGKNISRQGVRCKSCAMLGNKNLAGYIPSEATCLKLSASHKGKVHTTETKRKQSATKLRERNPNWNGGRSCIRGYALVLCPEHPKADFNGYIPEHRLALEKRLGRFLKPGEVVHHIDMDKSNNSPDNLVALNRREHQQYHGRLNNYINEM